MADLEKQKQDLLDQLASDVLDYAHPSRKWTPDNNDIEITDRQKMRDAMTATIAAWVTKIFQTKGEERAHVAQKENARVGRKD